MKRKIQEYIARINIALFRAATRLYESVNLISTYIFGASYPTILVGLFGKSEGVDFVDLSDRVIDVPEEDIRWN